MLETKSQGQNLWAELLSSTSKKESSSHKQIIMFGKSKKPFF